MVYDVMDTEGEDSPQEFLKGGLGRKPIEVIDKIHPTVLEKALREAKGYGIKILIKEQSCFKGGHITTIMPVIYFVTRFSIWKPQDLEI